MSEYKENSLSLTGAVAMGTCVMIGAGIFALLGQVAELSGEYFAYAFVLGGIISGFSAYSYIKMSNAYPSAGGIAMYLQKAYGKGTITAAASLLMAFSTIIATISGVIASIFAVSRMTGMLTEMHLIPHSHLGMSGTIQRHMLVYIVAIAIILTIFFDLSRIASLGAIFYLVMDIIVHVGVFWYLRKEVKAKLSILITAIILDIVVLTAFLIVKAQTDVFIIYVAVPSIILIFIAEFFFLKKRLNDEESVAHSHDDKTKEN